MNVVAFVPFASVNAPAAFCRLLHRGRFAAFGMSAATSARKVGAAAAPDVGPANTKLAVWVLSVGNAKVPAAVAPTGVLLYRTLSPANCPASTLLVVGRVSVGVAALAGTVIVYFPDAVATRNGYRPSRGTGNAKDRLQCV